MPKFSVVIPTYNRAEKLDYCLNSLVNQTFQDFEVLVCDDASTDHTEAVASKYAEKLVLKYFKNLQNSGPARARNTGIRESESPIIAFLDSDDWWTPDKLQRCLSAFDAGADVVYHTLFFARDRDRPSRKKMNIRKLKSPVYDDMLTRGHANPTSGTLVRKEILEKVGGFSEKKDLIGWEDYDCWLKIANLTDNFVLIPHSLGYYGIGEDNLTNPVRAFENLRAMKKYYFNDDSSKLPFWYYDRKSFAYHDLKQYKLAYEHKFRAFWLAPGFKFKWKIFKVFIKWMLRLS